MKGLMFIAATAFMAGAPMIAAAAPQRPAATPARDWSKTVVTTPEGGFRMGNPDAPLKLVEYGSLTCNHCANFASAATAGIMQRVKSGRLSFEFRNFVRDPADLGAALLSRCAGPANYFQVTDAYFASQSQWIGRIQAIPQATIISLNDLPPQQQVARLALLGGLDTVAARWGVTPARAQQCLSDDNEIKRLTAMRGVAVSRYNLQGTPTFVINDKAAENVHDWASLQPLLGPLGR